MKLLAIYLITILSLINAQQPSIDPQITEDIASMFGKEFTKYLETNNDNAFVF